MLLLLFINTYFAYLYIQRKLTETKIVTISMLLMKHPRLIKKLS